MPADLETAQAAFRAVESGLDGTEGTAEAAHQALQWFARHACADVPRVRRELFGPAGVPGDAVDPVALSIASPDGGEAAICAMAFPGAGEMSDDMARTCAQAMPQFYDMVQPDAKAEVHRRAVAAALRLTQEGWDAEILAALNRDCACLMTPETRFSGLAIALGIMAALDGDAGQAAFSMVQKMVMTVRDEHRASLAASPAVEAALQTLATHADATPVRHLLPDIPLAPVALQNPLPATPLFNTLVTVFSCRAHLETRIPAMRAAWLRDLAALGIPYVVIVGDGDGTLDGDVLAVDAPDDYEGLPQKTLATIRWVHDQTSYTHMFKVDDDCFLNAAGLFGDYSYRKSDYYGRPLTRGVVQTDRAWHIPKATTERGRSELDKSPEPSTYADGGSGYALSRRGMACALRAAQSPAGQLLQQVSFMEDKLLGDLLSLEGIAIENAGYHVSVRRRMAHGGRPVSLWVNGFDASAAAPVKLVHMDTHEGQETARARLQAPILTPSKIWPSYQSVRLGYQTNTLELVGSATRLDVARDATVSVVACVRNEMFMLPHFLAHYRALGVESFLIADNGSDDGTLEFLADQPDVALFSVDTSYSLSRYGVAWQQALMSNFRVGRWSLVADVDELLVWQTPQRESLPQLLAGPVF